MGVGQFTLRKDPQYPLYSIYKELSYTIDRGMVWMAKKSIIDTLYKQRFFLQQYAVGFWDLSIPLSDGFGWSIRRAVKLTSHCHLSHRRC